MQQGSISTTPPEPHVNANATPFEAPLRHPWGSRIVVTLLWAGAIAVSVPLAPGQPLKRLAIGMHVAGLVIALGPIVLIDWYSLVWVAGLRSFRDVMRLAEASHPVIWLGSGLLLASGAFLEPDLHRPLTWVKLVAVLVLLHNGVSVRHLGRSLGRLRSPRRLGDIPRRLRFPMIALFTISQTGWWTAVVIGLATSFGRHGP
jgi:hypothetical protein